MSELSKLAKQFEKKFAAKNQFVYHIKTKDFQGKTLYPLADLAETYPALYKKQMKKYQGREDQPFTKIKLLDCEWQHCVNFSTLNPVKIFQLEELLGLPGYKNGEDCEILQFSLADFENLDYCLYDDNKSPKRAEAYSKVSPASYRETQFVPPETAKYFAECKEKGEYPLLFGNVTHLLVKGQVDISKAEILKFKATIKE